MKKQIELVTTLCVLLQNGGGTVLARTVQHLVDNFEEGTIDTVIADPELFTNKDTPHHEKYLQVAEICEEHRVPIVSVTYVESTLTTAVRPSKARYSALNPEMQEFHTKVKAETARMPAWDKKRDGSPQV